MRISLFEQYGALNSVPVFQAIRDGFKKIGIECTSMDRSADIAVIWSLVWAGRMKNNQQIWQEFRSSNRPVIVAEVGMLNRGLTWKLGVNGTGIDAYYGDVIPGRSEMLGIKLHPWTNKGTNIVIAAQRTDSEQWAGLPTSGTWLTQTVNSIKQHTDRPIIVRPHPRERIPNIPGCIIESPQPIPGSYDSFNYNQCLKTTWAVINHNSGPGCQAIINGIPAFVGNTSLATPVGNFDLSQIENPLRPDRTQWIDQLASTEWTIDEIASGLPLTRLLRL